MPNLRPAAAHLGRQSHRFGGWRSGPRRKLIDLPHGMIGIGWRGGPTRPQIDLSPVRDCRTERRCWFQVSCLFQARCPTSPGTCEAPIAMAIRTRREFGSPEHELVAAHSKNVPSDSLHRHACPSSGELRLHVRILIRVPAPRRDRTL